MAVRPNLNKIKVPQWMPQEPGAWFRMLELIFVRENITDEADKVLLVLQNVPPSDTQKIVSLAWKASYVAGDYANIKAAIIGMNTISDDEKLNRLFHSESLGDQRPSELYYKMKNLADSVVGGAVPTNVVFNRWVNMLPTNCISFAKALADNFDPAKHLASIDDLHALLANRGGNHVSSISTSRSSRNRSTSRDRSASRNRSSSRDRASSRDRSSSRVISKTSIPADLEHCSHVLVTNNATKGPLDRPKQGPFLVLKRNKHTFSIQTESGPRDVNIQHLTPTKVDKRTVTFNIPRKVGRPRKHPLPDPSAPARPRGRPRKSPASD
ncbi:hypothetical protein TYRP_010224 [Tyrophagus putrescentiae]|nr:hypothetical protein TYRP_010224 [Tyrophagus putrescentiae]